jgi:hypothetical protein
MIESQLCLTVLIEAAERLWAFLKSDQGQISFAALAMARAILHYLEESSIPEARELAAVLLAAMLAASVIAASETQVSSLVRKGFGGACFGATETAAADARNNR